MPIPQSLFAVNFYIKDKPNIFHRNILSQVPSKGDVCVFNDMRYTVWSAEWCLDDGATNHGYQALINIELVKGRVA